MGENSDTRAAGDDNRGVSRMKSRRRVLQAMGGASAVATVTGLTSAQETTSDSPEQETTTAGSEATPIVLGGQVTYWLGLAPAPIESQQNPTLQLQTGEQYRLIWVNLDGERHQWQIEDGEGTILQQTDPTQRVGATQSITFQATDEMAQYRCQFHPEQMQGAIELGAGVETTTTAETTDTGQTTTAAGGGTIDVAVGPEGNYLQFAPEEVQISVGDTVRWTAKTQGHNVSCKPEAHSKVQLPDGAEPFATYEGNRSFLVMEVGETFTHTFTVPGTYVYVCVPHAGQGMVGRVIVSE